MSGTERTIVVPPDTVTPMSVEQAKSRRARNIAIGLAVAALVVLFYAVTVVKLGPGVLSQPS